MRRLFVICALTLFGGICSARDLPYEDILDQLADLDRLTHYEPGVEAGQFSSYHRDDATRWATNADAGNFLRTEPNGEAVMMEQEGPGCIVRIWSANPEGTLRIYLDGATEPTLSIGFNDLFLGQTEPFTAPLVWKREPQPMSAADCYLPIPFARSVKVTCDVPGARFYHVGYLTYPKDWTVESFHLPLDADETAARDRGARAWAQPGLDPKPRLAGQRTITRKLRLEPGATETLLALDEPGVIRAIHLGARSEQRALWRKLVLTGTWDAASEPQVLSPIGPFFGLGDTAVDYASLIAGCRDGRCWFYYPMPFRQSAELTLTSFLELPAEVECEIEWAPLPESDREPMWFFARWRKERDSVSLDYPFIETAGKGQLVGVSMQIDHPIPGWWGEGDEKIWIDDDRFPRWIGTGSEDYFGDAWGIRHLDGQSWGASGDPELLGRARTQPYRWHFMDPIPFSKRLRMTIENYGSWFNLEPNEFEYTSVAYWYQTDKTPPWSELDGQRYTGGTVYLQTPSEYSYSPKRFPKRLTAEDVRTEGLSTPFAHEAEDSREFVRADASGRVVTDACEAWELSRERGVDFGEVRAGQRLGSFRLRGVGRGVVFPTLMAAPVAGGAELTLVRDGQPLPIVERPATGRFVLGGMISEGGILEADLVATSDGRALVDAVVLAPASRREEVLEAEEVLVEGSPGVLGAPLPSLSAGRAVELRATATGQGLRVRIPRKNDLPYVLGMAPVFGPDAPIVQGWSGGKALGAPVDLYRPDAGTSPIALPLGAMPEGESEIEVRVVGKNPASSGMVLRIDWFRFEAMILHPESDPSISARVVGYQNCAYRIQDVGPAWVGGHHLWLQPAERGAAIEIGLEVPSAGSYRLEGRLTTSWDYGIARVGLDGQPVGEPVDCFTKEVRQTPVLDWGVHALSAGTHILRIETTEKSEGSAGYLLGLDYVKVTPAR